MIIGILQILASSLMFSILAFLVKEGAQKFSVYELAFFRSVIALVIVAIFLILANIPFRPQRWRGILLRAIMGVGSLVFYFKSLSVLPMANAVVINYSLPIVVGLVTYGFAKPRPTPLSLLLALLGVVGITLIANPDWGRFDSASLWGLISLGFMTVAFMTLHELAGKYHPEVITFYFSLIGSLILSPAVVSTNPSQLFDHLGLVMAIGLTATLGQSLMTRGYARLSLVLATQLQLSTILFSTFFGILALNETLTSQTLVGMILIISTSLILIPLNRENLKNLPWSKSG